MVRKTTEQFIKESKEIHGDKYDYSLVEYINSKTKIKIICKKHGIFAQTPNCHLLGKGCPKCVGKNKTLEEFIQECKNIHGDKYNYSLVEYINNKIKVKIICPTHGVFEQTPNSHLNNHGCTKCKIDKLKTTKKFFIEKSKKVHCNKFDYSLVDYIHSKIKVKIICPTHGIFEQQPNEHLMGKGCFKCRVDNTRKTNNDFISESNIIHGGKYDYSLVDYNTTIIKVKIICPIHGVFEQTPNSHLNGSGCPNCNTSKGENKIKTFLENNNINFETQKTFEKCKNKHKLRFDFYLPSYNICIEFDGEQHFKEVKRFGRNRLLTIQQNDKIKNEYCKNNNINLLRIKYNENIDEKLKQLFNIFII